MVIKRPRSLKGVRIIKRSGNRTYYKKKKPSSPHCALCGREIIFYSQGKQAKTKRRAERPLPNLCSKCMRKVILSKIRGDVPISLMKYAKQVKIEIPENADKQQYYVKIAGRDAGDVVKITREIDDTFVEVQGTIRKKPRKVNRAHLEPLLVKKQAEPEPTSAGKK